MANLVKKFKATDCSANHRTIEQCGLQDPSNIIYFQPGQQEYRICKPWNERHFLYQAQPLAISGYLTTESC